MPTRTAVCTIVSANYLALARTLMASLREVHPEWEPYVLIVDEIGDRFDRDGEPFRVVELDEIPLPDRKRFLFRYTILELNTAVKPWFLSWLFEKSGCDRVVYLDPDIYAYRPLEEVERALDAGSLACLTPHLTGPLDRDRKPNELDILRAGAYNLGFLALGKHPDLERFLTWWQTRVEFDCVVDLDAGLFVDQKWIDLVPGLYPDVSILRHEGYNVGYWNLAHREVERGDDGFRVNGAPLVFFHFSGLDVKRPAGVSKHQDRFSLRRLGDARELVLRYCEQVLAQGHDVCKDWPYAYGRLADGAPLVDEIRALYRRDKAVQEAGADDPFELGAVYFNEVIRSGGGPGLTRMMRHIWETRPDLQQHFPEAGGRDSADFAYWFAQRIALEHELPEVYVAPARKLLRPAVKVSWRRRIRAALGRPVERLRPLARRLPPGAKRWLRRLFGRRIDRSLATIRPHAVLGFGVNFAGFFPMDAYDASVSSAWMGSKALVRLVESDGGPLRLVGEHAPSLHERAHGGRVLRLSVRLDDEEIDEIVLEGEGVFEAEVEIPRPTTARSVLGIEATHCFVPARIGVAEDARELSVRLSRIHFCGRPLIDFSRGAAAYVPERRGGPPRLGLNIVGYLQSELGVGESARICAEVARTAGISFSLVDFNVGCSSRSEDGRWAHALGEENPHHVNLLHVNADQVPVMHAHFGQPFFENHYNIGFWHWELPELPDEWLGSFSPLNEVWAPSRFVQEAISAKSPVPVVRIPHAISFAAPEDARRARFGLPEGDFLFLSMYDMHSIQERKNPEGAIEAFRRAFPDGRGAGLVVKVMNAESDPKSFARLRKRLEEVPGLILLTETLSRQDVYGLESVCDGFVSLHRSEGFGLGLAESMFLGKPVVGTNWSANTDFMNEANSCPVNYQLVPLERDHGPYRRGQIWADPDLDHAAWHMRRLVEDSGFRERVAAAGRRTIHTEFSPSAVGRRYRSRLDTLARLL